MANRKKIGVVEIRAKRLEAEKGEIICIVEINQNIKNVMEGKPLTRPLRTLNKNCEFKKRYDAYFDYANEDRIKKEINEKRKLKDKIYNHSPAGIARKNKYYTKLKEKNDK